ncbi:MAG: EamA family transporter [Alphaproteobacteria bacterium]|nr:EamA family transporter [Alphaproteobacteria bacterium]
MAHSSKSSFNWAALAALSFAVFTWGVAFVFVRSLVLAMGPADSIVIRMWSVAIICIPLLAYTGFHIEKKDIGRLLLTGAIGNFGYFLGTIFGFAHVTASVGGIIIATQPLLIALLAAATGLEKLKVSVILGIIVSFAGTVFLVSGSGEGTSVSNSELLLGSAMIFMSGVGWAIYVVAGKPLIQKYGALKITAYSLFLCAPPTLVFASSSTWHALNNMTFENWGSLFYLSVIATFIALIFWNYAVGYMKSSTAGASLYLVPILSVLAGWAYLGESVTVSTVIAGAIILLGVAIAQFGGSLVRDSQNSAKKNR